VQSQFQGVELAVSLRPAKKHFCLQPTRNSTFVNSANFGYISDIIIIISATVVMAKSVASFDALSLGFKPVGEIQNPPK